MLSLRPRYSLLTLLILTALVAGGVKLWYGPHHVVEWEAANTQVEYTYTRNWNGERIIQGVHRWRKTQYDNQIHIVVDYYRDGSRIDHRQWITADIQTQLFYSNLGGVNPLSNFGPEPLHPEELREFQAAVEKEVESLRQRGYR